MSWQGRCWRCRGQGPQAGLGLAGRRRPGRESWLDRKKAPAQGPQAAQALAGRRRAGLLIVHHCSEASASSTCISVRCLQDRQVEQVMVIASQQDCTSMRHGRAQAAAILISAHCLGRTGKHWHQAWSCKKKRDMRNSSLLGAYAELACVGNRHRSAKAVATPAAAPLTALEDWQVCILCPGASIRDNACTLNTGLASLVFPEGF